MDKLEILIQKINLLEYHQKLLLQLLNNPTFEFNKLIIEKGLTEQEVNSFHQLCEKLSLKLEEQKAEGYVYFHPLFVELSELLPKSMKMKDVIHACLKQNLHVSLFQELMQYC